MVPARLALPAMVQPPRARAATAVRSQVASQASVVSRVSAIPAATKATRPIPTPPHPGTAVNSVARSMVWRMKRRLSMARWWSAGSSAGGGDMRWGEAMVYMVMATLDFIKYFMQQSALQAARRSDVHCGHRVAPMGIAIRQYGQSLVFGATAAGGFSRFAARTIRKTAKAMIRNVMMLLTKTP